MGEASSPPSIEARDLGKEYGPITALDGLDLHLEGSQIVGVAGPNGSGKTTLIRCLLGLVKPSRGRVRVRGRDPLAFTAEDRERIGYMPQHEALYRELTVRENVDFFARLYGVEDRAAAVGDALSFVDLEHRASARISELSGGMTRRTSLACAIVHEPELLLLDEPTVGLDPELREAMWAGFQERTAQGVLALISTHYLGEARHCDRVVFLREGRVLAQNPPDVFLSQTGTSDLEDAFLKLLQADPSQAAGGAL